MKVAYTAVFTIPPSQMYASCDGSALKFVGSSFAKSNITSFRRLQFTCRAAEQCVHILQAEDDFERVISFPLRYPCDIDILSKGESTSPPAYIGTQYLVSMDGKPPNTSTSTVVCDIGRQRHV